MRAVIAVGIAISLTARSVSFAQPAPDLGRARDLYVAAEAAMTAARYADALRDYGAAYELTQDPVLFFKIASANDKLGRCDLAVVYYRRYLKEAAPDAAFVTLTTERIAACTKPASPEPEPEPEPVPAPPVPSPAPVPASPAPDTNPAPDATPAPATALPVRHQGPWLLLGASAAMLTTGAVLAYSANAAERDLRDLYAGPAGVPPAYDARTAARYRDAIDEGRRYEKLSLISFGVAGALIAGAAVWFALEPAPVVVTPTVSADGAGVAGAFRF